MTPLIQNGQTSGRHKYVFVSSDDLIEIHRQASVDGDPEGGIPAR